MAIKPEVGRQSNLSVTAQEKESAESITQKTKDQDLIQ